MGHSHSKPSKSRSSDTPAAAVPLDTTTDPVEADPDPDYFAINQERNLAATFTRQAWVRYLLYKPRLTIPDPDGPMMHHVTNTIAMQRTCNRLLKLGMNEQRYDQWINLFTNDAVYVTIEGEVWKGKETMYRNLMAQLSLLPGGNFSIVRLLATDLNSLTVIVENTWTSRSGNKFGFINYTTLYYSDTPVDAEGLGRFHMIVDTANMSVVKAAIFDYLMDDAAAFRTFAVETVKQDVQNLWSEIAEKVRCQSSMHMPMPTDSMM